MTSQSPRNRRTTAPRTTRLRTAAKLAAAALLFGGPASAQQPGLAYGAAPAPPIVPAPGGEAPRLDPTAPGYVPPPLPAFGPPGYRTGLQEPAPQPQESTSQKRQDLPKPIDEDPRRRAEATRLPSRQVIFTMYDDVELEKLIIRAVREDIIRLQKQSDGKPPEKPVVPPAADQRLEFPSLADIRNRLSPPGVPYVAKTVNYAPNKVVYEPIYVIHRRLHFEEKNTERYG